MANYKLSPEAEADLIRIHQWGVNNFGEAQADKYFYKMIEQFEKIAENPMQFPSIDIREGYRRCVFGRDSIYYRVKDDFVEVMAIIGQQDIGNWV